MIERAVVIKVLKDLRGLDFSSFDFARALEKIEPSSWRALEKRYGKGGRGSGRSYSPYSYISRHVLPKYKTDGLRELGLHVLPANLYPHWGSTHISLWRYDDCEGQQFPNEIDENEWPEGTTNWVKVNRFERNRQARLECLRVHGCKCRVCGFDFEETYGALGEGFIHVHHIIPLSKIRETYSVNPITDLVPVCPNCHAMLHKGPEVLTVEQLREVIEQQS